MSQGCIYIFSNPSLIGNPLKIGKTTRTPEERAKELSGTGLPDGFIVEYYEHVFDCHLCEKIIHKNIDEYRHNKTREFFKLPLQEAILKVQEVTQGKIYSQRKINKYIHRLNENMLFRWACQNNDYILRFRHKNLLSIFYNEIPSVHVWQCREGDRLIIKSKFDDYDDLINYDKLVDFGLNILEKNRSLTEIIDIYPGDRLVWVAKKNKTYLNNYPNESYSVKSIIDCLEYAKIIVSSQEELLITKEGYPLPFGSPLNKIPNTIILQAYFKIKELGIPNTWASPTMDLP